MPTFFQALDKQTTQRGERGGEREREEGRGREKEGERESEGEREGGEREGVERERGEGREREGGEGRRERGREGGGREGRERGRERGREGEREGERERGETNRDNFLLLSRRVIVKLLRVSLRERYSLETTIPSLIKKTLPSATLQTCQSSSSSCPQVYHSERVEQRGPPKVTLSEATGVQPSCTDRANTSSLQVNTFLAARRRVLCVFVCFPSSPRVSVWVSRFKTSE